MSQVKLPVKKNQLSHTDGGETKLEAVKTIRGRQKLSPGGSDKTMEGEMEGKC